MQPEILTKTRALPYNCRRAPPVNLPNAITLGRIFLVPLLVVVMLTKFDGPLVFGVSKITGWINLVILGPFRRFSGHILKQNLP